MLCKLFLCMFVGLLLITNVFGNEKNNSVTDETVSKGLMQNTSTLVTQKPMTGEVDDLLHGGKFKNLSHHIEKVPELISYSENFENNGKWDVELIEDGSNTEDERIKHFSKAFHNSQKSGENYGLVTILVVSVIVVVIGGYGAYYSWRKLDDRCRRRKTLINGADPDDMRHFSI